MHNWVNFLAVEYILGMDDVRGKLLKAIKSFT